MLTRRMFHTQRLIIWLASLLTVKAMTSRRNMQLGQYSVVTATPGNYSNTFEVDLAGVGNTLGMVRIDVQSPGTYFGNNPPSLFISSKPYHDEILVGNQNWDSSMSYEWSMTSVGGIHISTCRDHNGKKRTPGVHSENGYLSEETLATNAFCMKDLDSLYSGTELARQSQVDWTVDGPNEECRCLDTQASDTMYLRLFCPLFALSCEVEVHVSALCSHGKVLSADGNCGLCPKSKKYHIISEPVVEAICLNATETCPAGTFTNQVHCNSNEVALLEGDENLSPWELCSHADAVDKCEGPEEASSSGSTSSSESAEEGQCFTKCEKCKQPSFSRAGDKICNYTALTCPTGTYAVWEKQACSDCPYGKFSTEPNAGSSYVCVDCGEGRYSSTLGSSTEQDCLGCESDTYNDLPAAKECKICPNGRLTLLKESPVEQKFRLSQGLPPPTPNATRDQDKKDGKPSCRELCKLGQHYTSNEECLPCLGGEKWCIGTDECLGNRTGDGCTRCSVGFYTGRGEICTPCPEDSIGSLIVLIIIVAVLLGLLFVFTGSSRPEASMSSLTIIISHIQIQGYLIKFPINWPPEFIWFVKFLASIFTFDVPALVPAPECSFEFGVESKYFFSMGTLPFILILIWLAPLLLTTWYSLCRFRGCFCSRKPDKLSGNKCTGIERTIVHKALGVSTIIFSIMYGFLAPSSTQLGLCSKRPSEASLPGAQTWMNEDPSVECFWYHYLAAVLFGMIYVAGIPLILGLFLIRGHNRKLLFDEESWIPDYVGWIYLRFEHSLFWWELVNMLQKTFIGITERVGSGPPAIQFQCIHDTYIIQNDRDLCNTECANAFDSDNTLSNSSLGNTTLLRENNAGSELCIQMADPPPVAQLVITFLILTLSLGLHIFFRPYAPMQERSAIKTEKYSFTITGSKRKHGVTFDVLPGKERGISVHSANEDAKHRPECNDFKHHLHLEDKIISINGMDLPHVYKRRKKKRFRSRRFTFMHHHEKAEATKEDTKTGDEANTKTGDETNTKTGDETNTKTGDETNTQVSTKKDPDDLAVPRIDLPTFYGYIEANGKNGCTIIVERELRFHGSEHLDGVNFLKAKRKCTPEDILAIVCNIASIMALIFALVNPGTPKEALTSVKDAKNAAERGELDTQDEQTQGAAGIAILILLFILLFVTIVYAVVLFVKAQWWKIKETFTGCCKKKAKNIDPDRKRADRETAQKIIDVVDAAKAEIEMEVKRKREERKERRRSKKTKSKTQTMTDAEVSETASLDSTNSGTDIKKEGEKEDDGEGEDI